MTEKKQQRPRPPRFDDIAALSKPLRKPPLISPFAAGYDAEERLKNDHVLQFPQPATAEASCLQQTGTPDSGAPQAGIPTSAIPAPAIPAPAIPNSAASTFGTLGSGLKIRRAFTVQDGHSLGEQLVLEKLWNSAQPVAGKPYRMISVGYRRLSDAVHLTVNNTKANLRSLQAKLAIEPEGAHSSVQATTYRVYSFAEILRRREAAGLTHVLRSRGSVFVNPETGIPVSGIPITPPVPVLGIPEHQTGIPDATEKGIPDAGNPLRNLENQLERKETTSTSFPLVAGAFLNALGRSDDNAVARLVTGCRTVVPDATEEEIAHFLRTEASRFRNNPRIHNLSGLMITQVPKCFEGESFRLFRAAQQQAKEVAQREQQESERRHQALEEEHRRILEDPNSSKEDKHFARLILGLEDQPES